MLIDYEQSKIIKIIDVKLIDAVRFVNFKSSKFDLTVESTFYYNQGEDDEDF